MLRLFCTYEHLTRFVMPLCSAMPPRKKSDPAVTDTTCIVDISGVSFLQFWRLQTHLQAASSLATAHYPEILGETYVGTRASLKRTLTPLCVSTYFLIDHWNSSILSHFLAMD